MDSGVRAVLASTEAATWRDYVQVTKPRVVALIVFTAFVGMLLAVPGWPPLGRLLAATLGIALAAASAAAFNHLLDRQIDAHMLRTRYRPLPQGHLTPGQVWVLATILACLSLLVLWGMVNWLTAVLTFGSLIGYALVYTRFLKTITPQNIVIGGAAGAAPPVLGWVAMTDHVSAVSLSLFMIVFVWTPPHFWALAIGRKEDYSRAGIPMLPVTHGVRFTILQITFYSVLLLVVSYLPDLLGAGGWLFLIGVTALNAGFGIRVFRLIRSPSPASPALGLFRYSISYLTLFFVVLLLCHYLPGPWGVASRL
ncbi:protoheme IX farnesyltransferase [mine drainage metagenome]|uniref:Protoheme IX farnesyltransferase n=1 Tax=mine drainage metagenome TaxID=410659 RepID=T0YRJ8_9ZZZZ